MVFLVFMYPVLTGQDGVCTFMATGAFFCLLHMRKDYYLIFERRIYMDFLFSPLYSAQWGRNKKQTGGGPHDTLGC